MTKHHLRGPGTVDSGHAYSPKPGKSGSKGARSLSLKESARIEGVLPRPKGRALPPSGRDRRQPKNNSRREKLLDDIGAMLDVLTEDGLSHVLAVATMCRYELALVRSEAQREADRLPELAGDSLRIERSADGSTYHLISGKIWKILAAEDIASLLRISRHEESESQARKQLYHWMKAERRDIAHDFDIHGEASPVLKELLVVLAETFPVKSPRRLP